MVNISFLAMTEQFSREESLLLAWYKFNEKNVQLAFELYLRIFLGFYVFYGKSIGGHLSLKDLFLKVIK